jgi:hypothetical protein
LLDVGAQATRSNEGLDDDDDDDDDRAFLLAAKIKDPVIESEMTAGMTAAACHAHSIAAHGARLSFENRSGEV